jgi:hypothetical protein
MSRKSSVAHGDSGERKETVLSCYVEANPEPQESTLSKITLDKQIKGSKLSCHAT